MKHITILLGVCLLVLCTAPVHALFAGDDVISGYWCPAGGWTMDGIENNILFNDIPNSPPVIPILVEDAMYGYVILSRDGRVVYFPNSNQWDINHAYDSFRYRTFDGLDYSNEATVGVLLYPYMPLYDESLKFSTPKDTMLSTQISQWYQMVVDYSGPSHGTLVYDWETTEFHYMPDPGFEGVDRMEYRVSVDTGSCGIMYGMPGTIEITVGNPNPIPEFPSAVLPAIVVGFLGAVFLIRRTRED